MVKGCFDLSVSPTVQSCAGSVLAGEGQDEHSLGVTRDVSRSPSAEWEGGVEVSII